MPYIVLSVVLAILWHLTVARAAPRFGLLKVNFRNDLIMSSYGLIEFPYIATAAIILCASGVVECTRVWQYLTVMGVMWILGAIDDIWGSREVSGFKGHFRKLLFEGKVTTGAVKALGGGLTALGAGFWLYNDSVFFALQAGSVIALSSNLINLFDLRPGRAVAIIFFGLVVTYIVKCGRLVAMPLVGAIAAIALAFGIVDARGKAMMGDSGSNSLGAALGMTIALSAPNWMLPAIILMAAVHIYSEKRSISGAIESNRLLKEIDRRLGVR
ncbi:MAG: hypothetical protein GX139_11095 [Armatimonadetes bacterium]|jgi:UDP-N-acetylmuramyl pentapeptide phosphotransferase/UDP-N-acetylglucosamine-1-phosphate transferase|nr:hypothetical protein [Armatimonadota bacterium]